MPGGFGGFFDDDSDEDVPVAAPAPAPARVERAASVPTASASPCRASTAEEPDSPCIVLKKVSMLDRLNTSSLDSAPAFAPAPAPAPAAAIPRDDEPPTPKRQCTEAPGGSSPEPGGSAAGPSGSSISDILAKLNAATAQNVIEENARRGGSRKAPVTQKVPAPRKAPTGSASKRPRMTEQDVEREADEFEAELEDELDEEEEEADDVPPAIDDDDDDTEEWPRFDTAGHGPKEPHALGTLPGHVAGSQYPAELTIPASVNQHLRHYQREGVEFLTGQYIKGKGGVLGDEMGLGKTVQTIAFLSAVLGKTATAQDKQRLFPLAQDDRKQVLVVVPTSTLTNWEREFKTWGCFRVKRCHGNQRDDALRAATDGMCEVVLTTYTMICKNVTEFGAVNWAVAIFDEVHMIKNPKGKQRAGVTEALNMAKCRSRFGLSGTPMSNKFEELWSLFDFVSEASVGSRPDFKKYYGAALGQGLKRKASQFELTQRMKRQVQLKQLMERWMLQRFKTIIKDQMPTKEDNIVFCSLASEQQVVYERVLESPDYAMLKNADQPCPCGSGQIAAKCAHNHDPDGVLFRWTTAHRGGEPCPRCPYCIGLPAVTQLLKVSNHLELLKPDPKRTKPGSDEYMKATEFTRMALGEEHGASRVIERDMQFLSQSDETSCGKMRAVVALLRLWKAQKKKVLLFSYSTQMLDILQDLLIRRGYIFLRLDGSTPATKRGKLVDDFNNIPEKFIFLLSTKAGGLGLNLVSATVVLVFDPNWNPSHDMQAQDRAYRIGQRHDVKVYRLIATNTVEEKIYQRQLYKQGQEGLVLHQRDEHRYFDGVMDDKKNKGELFGFRNLLSFDPDAASAAGGSTTRALLGRESSTLEGGEQECYYIRKDRSREKGPAPDDDEADEADGADEGADDEFGIGAAIPELRADGGAAAAGRSGDGVDDMLRASGMVHTHVNDKVLGGGHLPKDLPSAAAGGDDDDDMLDDGSEALPWARPRPGVKPEPGAKSEPGAAVKAEGGRAVLHGSDREVKQLLSQCDTFDDYVGDMREDAEFAKAVMQCLGGVNGAKLVERVNALPRAAVA